MAVVTEPKTRPTGESVTAFIAALPDVDHMRRKHAAE
jgi:hypothetical protein